MSIVLKNKNITLEFNKPEEGYNGTRFSYVGKLVEMKFHGVSCVTSELKNNFSENSGAGFYNEFDINTALGFEEVEVGEWFHKIGVGLLKKDETSYNFFKLHEVIPAEISFEIKQESVSFHCFQKEYNGYGYELIQKCVLKDDGFEIQYTLQNTGSKNIKTIEYNHNFLAVDHAVVNSDCQLNFPCGVKTSSDSEIVNPETVFQLFSEKLTFNGTPKSDFFLSDLQSESDAVMTWEFLHNNIKIQSTTDFNPIKMNIWGTGHVVSPELFAEIQVAPRTQKTWKRTYKFEHY